MTIYLSNYAHFKDKYEMDNASNQHITTNWNQLNTTDRSVLDMDTQIFGQTWSCSL